MPTENLPRGMKASRLASRDLERIKRYWLNREVRSDASWTQFLKTYDTSRSFSIDPRSNGVELPLSIRGDGRENIMLLFHTGDRIRAVSDPLTTLTLMQTTTRGSIVGGSTFVFKAARLR